MRDGLAQRLVSLSRNRRGSVGFTIGSQFALWLGLGIVMAAVQGRSVVAGAFTFAHMALVMSGFMLVASGWKRRVGDEPRCATCGYERGPAEMQADLPDHCPECGSNWNARGGVAYGRLQRRPWVWMVGAAMVALGFALIMSPLARRGWQFRIMPTGSLIREITQAPRGFTVDEWAALRARTLSPSQREQLARGLLDKRLRKTFFSADADNWIVAQITAGTLAPALRDRYYAEAVDAWIIGPETARVGEAVTLALGTRLRHASTNNAKPLLLVGGYIVGEDAPPQSREDKALSASLVGQQRLHVADRDAGPGRSPECVITPREPGVITIHAPIWVIYAPGTTSMAITWQDDGTPTLPPGPVPFMETRVLEHRIVVTP